MSRVPRGQQIPWGPIFRRWLKDRPALDRIDFVDVERIPGQEGWYAMSGPVIRLQRTFSGEVK